MNMAQTEWIGKTAAITASKNHTLVGMNGIIVDETLNLITLETPTGTKMIPKRNTTFQINNQTIQGDKFLIASHEQIKVK